MKHQLAGALAILALTSIIAPESELKAQQSANRFDYAGSIERARSMAKNKQTPAAIALLTEAIAQAPSRSEAYVERANAYRDAGDFNAALTDNAEAMRLQPNLRDGHTVRAVLFRMLGRDTEALDEIHKLAAKSRDPRSLQVAAIYFAQYERYDEADDTLIKLAGIGGDRGQIFVQRGQTYAPDDVATRLADFERGLSLKPDYVFGFQEWGDLLRQTGDHAKAITVYTRGLALDGKDAKMLAGRETSYRALGDTAHAVRDAEAMARLKDRSYALFMTCRAKGEANVDLFSALSACDAAVSEEPTAPGRLHDRGMVLLRLQRFADAITVFDQALTLNRFLPDPLFARALARKALGDEAGAKTDAAIALRIDPRTAKKFKVLGLSL